MILTNINKALVKQWREWYDSSVQGIHKNRKENVNENIVTCNLKALNIPKMIIDDMTTYVTNEIIIESSVLNELEIDKHAIRDLVKTSLVFGRAYMFITNEAIHLLSEENVVFRAAEKGTGYYKKADITLNNGAKPIIYFDDMGEQKLMMYAGERIELAESKKILFDFTPIRDVINISGKALYADAIPTIEALDLINTELYNEFVLSRKMVAVHPDALKVAAVRDGENVDIQTFLNTSNRLFKFIPGDNKELFKEYAPVIRTNDFIQAMQYLVGYITKSCRMGSDYLSFDSSKGTVAKTKFEVKADKSDLYTNVKDIQDQLLEFMKDIIMHNIVNGIDNPDDVILTFSENLFTDSEAFYERGKSLLEMGVISNFHFLTYYAKYPEEEARQLLREIVEEREADLPTDLMV